MKITKRQLRRIIREVEDSTKKYDDDSALKGGQNKLPDGLQKGIIDKSVEDRETREEEEREEKNESIRVTRRQLRRIIREAMDVVNRDTGEIIDFGEDSMTGMPDFAVYDLISRLGLNLDSTNNSLSSDDFEKLEDETTGKQDHRRRKKMAHGYKKERERLNVDNLLKRLDKWAQDAGADWTSDRMGLDQDTDLQDVAYDLAGNARYEFQEDEWDELVWHFDDDENDLRSYIIGAM
jgi:hypothetical protein